VQELEELFQLHSVEELLLLLIKVVENDFDVFPFPDVFSFVFLDWAVFVVVNDGSQQNVHQEENSENQEAHEIEWWPTIGIVSRQHNVRKVWSGEEDESFIQSDRRSHEETVAFQRALEINVAYEGSHRHIAHDTQQDDARVLDECKDRNVVVSGSLIHQHHDEWLAAVQDWLVLADHDTVNLFNDTSDQNVLENPDSSLVIAGCFAPLANVNLNKEEVCEDQDVYHALIGRRNLVSRKNRDTG
jgi:hypothetical protein